ncbi:WD repeat-containing protein 6 [Actinomortierella wolfii]|nr:WD repeat-containing protein 6 [Actinomortierella wolfii]
MRSVHLSTPVTALGFHQHDILLSGQGPYLKATNVATAESLACIHLGGDFKVHRILLGNFRTFNHVDRRTHVGSRDSVQTSPSSIAVAYAHNFVDVYEFPGDLLDATTTSSLADLHLSYTVQSEEHCTLFCGRFHNNTLEDLMFASGTSFCQALIWKVHHPGGGEAPVDKTLIGHEGILFGIRWSEDGKHLTTVSDDRTIRLWDLTKSGT